MLVPYVVLMYVAMAALIASAISRSVTGGGEKVTGTSTLYAVPLRTNEQLQPKTSEFGEPASASMIYTKKYTVIGESPLLGKEAAVMYEFDSHKVSHWAWQKEPGKIVSVPVPCAAACKTIVPAVVPFTRPR